MKKILWTAGAYLVTVVAQLVCIVVFLLSRADPINKAITLSVLLLLSAAAFLAFDQVVKGEEKRGRVDERLACLIYLGQKQVSLLLSAGILNLVVAILDGFWNVPLVVSGAAVICFVLACVIALVQLLRMTRSREEEGPEEASEDVPPDAVESQLFQSAGDLNDGPGADAGEQ